MDFNRGTASVDGFDVSGDDISFITALDSGNQCDASFALGPGIGGQEIDIHRLESQDPTMDELAHLLARGPNDNPILIGFRITPISFPTRHGWSTIQGRRSASGRGFSDALTPRVSRLD